MYKSSGTHCRMNHRGTARRLRVEAMESRLMLSAAPLNLTHEVLQPPQLAWNGSELSHSSARPVRIATLADGGFISFDSSPSGDNYYPTVRTMTPGSGAAINGAFSQLISGSEYSKPLYFNSLADGANSHIRPAIIQPLILVATTAPVSVGAAEPTNGGAIEIQSIIVNVEPRIDLQTAMQPQTASSIEPVSEPRQEMNFPAPSLFKSIAMASEHITYSHDDFTLSSDDTAIADQEIAIPSKDVTTSGKGVAISGELARAIVFEITGGEPAKLDRPASDARHKWTPKPADAAIPNEGEPLSFKGNSRPAVIYLTSDRQSDDGSNDRNLGPSLSLGSIELTEAAVARLNSLAIVNDRSNTTPLDIMTSVVQCDTNAEGLGISDFHAAGLAFTEPFEQLGLGEAAPSFVDVNWQTAFEATLVMLVLSLQQTTARNSREDQKRTATLATRLAGPSR